MRYSLIDRLRGRRPAGSDTAAAPVASAVSWTVLAQQFTLRGPYGVGLALQVGIGAALGWMAPFGTATLLGPLDRFGYWMLAIPVVGVPASMAITIAFASPRLRPWPWPAKLLAAAVVSAVPGLAIVEALAGAFSVGFSRSLAALASTYAAVVLLTVATGLWVMAATRRDQIWPPPEPAAPPSRRAGASPFLARIPPRLGGNLLHIETEDHYLRVHTDRGHYLVLFRLADALAELDTALGLQVHRSHWVARHAVAAVERDAHRTALRLTDGAVVPVSRTFLPVLRKAGWL